MTPEQIQEAVKRDNARDKKKLIVLTIFTVIWIGITMLNNIYISKKADGAVSWGNTLISDNKDIAINQQVILVNESNIISNQHHIEKRLIDIQNEMDASKSQPSLSPKEKESKINTVRSSTLTPFQSQTNSK